MSCFRVVHASISTSRYCTLRSGVCGHVGPCARLVRRIILGGCYEVSRVNRVRARFRVKVRVRDRCVQGLKCPRTKVTVHQVGPICGTEIIAIVQCMYADHVI